MRAARAFLILGIRSRGALCAAESDSRTWSDSDGAFEQLLSSVQAHFRSGDAAGLALHVKIHRTDFRSLISVLRARGEHLEELGISLVGAAHRCSASRRRTNLSSTRGLAAQSEFEFHHRLELGAIPASVFRARYELYAGPRDHTQAVPLR